MKTIIFNFVLSVSFTSLKAHAIQTQLPDILICYKYSYNDSSG